jgi:GTPase Era involved in 16S rRNA processing
MNTIDQKYNDLEHQQQSNGELSRTCVNRNVLLVGLSKSGKTTLRRVLADARHRSDGRPFSEPSTSVQLEKIEAYTNSTRLSLTIIELPGVMIKSKSNLQRINEECIKRGVKHFHLVCFCTTLDAGIDEDARQSFENFINHFGSETLSPNLCIIVTRCESKDDAQRKQLRDELMGDAFFAKLSPCLGRGIHFSGALNYDDWKRAKQTLVDQLETVYDYRKKLLSLINDDILPFKLPQR